MAHAWKACWGQPLASSNLASSALDGVDAVPARTPPWAGAAHPDRPPGRAVRLDGGRPVARRAVVRSRCGSRPGRLGPRGERRRPGGGPLCPCARARARTARPAAAAPAAPGAPAGEAGLGLAGRDAPAAHVPAARTPGALGRGSRASRRRRASQRWHGAWRRRPSRCCRRSRGAWTPSSGRPTAWAPACRGWSSRCARRCARCGRP